MSIIEISTFPPQYLFLEHLLRAKSTFLSSSSFQAGRGAAGWAGSHSAVRQGLREVTAWRQGPSGACGASRCRPDAVVSCPGEGGGAVAIATRTAFREEGEKAACTGSDVWGTQSLRRSAARKEEPARTGRLKTA